MADKITGSKLTDRDFLKVAGATVVLAGAGILGYKAAHVDNSEIGFDPEIQTVLEKEGINKDIHLRMYFGDHYFTENTAKKMIEQGVTVITGEIESRPSWDPEYKPEQPGIVKEFWKNLMKLPNGVTAFGQMQLSKERSQKLLTELSERSAILVSDPGKIEASNEAANRVLIGWSMFGALTYTVAAGIKTDIFRNFNVPITRRNFLKMMAMAPIALVASQIGSASYQTAENSGVINPPGNSEVSYIFSKVFKEVGEDVSTKYLELTSDERIAQAFQALVGVRNKVMALNNWYLIESLERNRGVKENLTGENDNVEIGFFAGLGHSASKYEFCKGPKMLEEEIKSVIDDWLVGYHYDLANTTVDAEKQNVIDYYKGLMKMFTRPQLVSKKQLNDSSEVTSDSVSDTQTSQAIMYRCLIEADERMLISELIKDQYHPDGIDQNIGGDNLIDGNGNYYVELTAKDPNAVKARLVESNFISPQDLTDKIDGEIYPNLYRYEALSPAIDKNISVGLAIVRGYPVTFFQKEDTSFIIAN